MTVITASTFYIIGWFFACNWVFFLPKRITDVYRFLFWLASLATTLLAGFWLDRHYLGPPHQAWQETTVYVVFVFMSLLFSTVGYLAMKSRP